MNESALSLFEGKDVLVTGGCGSIGSEIVRQLDQANARRVRVFDNNESGQWHLSQRLPSPRLRHLIGDVRDIERVRRAMEGVDIVFHAAALKHVPLCEYNPFEAVQTNVIGTRNVVVAANECGVDRFIGISTDKAVNPISTMGATKLLSEKIIVNAPLGMEQTKFCCVRFGNVVGSAGSVVPLFRQQIAAGGPVTVTSEEMTRFIMSIPQSVRLVLRAAERVRGHEVFVLKMERMRIIDLAEVMIEALAPRYGFRASQIEIDIIGKRPGEKMHELLLTEEETAVAEELDDLIVIRSSPFDGKARPPICAHAIQKAAMGRIIDKAEIRRVLEQNGCLIDPAGTPRMPSSGLSSSSADPAPRQRAIAG